LLHPDDPRAPQNRRITITVLTHEAEERLLGKQAPSAQQDNKLESENMEKQENSPPARQTP
jgi:chemotaxis protein MotB